jgi:hypothetical protein
MKRVSTIVLIWKNVGRDAVNSEGTEIRCE